MRTSNSGSKPILNIVPKKSEPNTAIVTTLKELLAMAEAGQLQELFVVGRTDDNTLVDNWILHKSHPQPYLMLGSVEALKHDMTLCTMEARYATDEYSE